MIESPTTLKLHGKKDRLFSTSPYPLTFEFNAHVAEVFDNMISRSIPFYREVIESECQWILEQPPTADQVVYDIGCSTGTTLFALGSQLSSPSTLIGIDTSPAMLDRARKKLAPLASFHRISLSEESALELDFHDAAYVLLNYTLQFIAREQRQTLLNRINQGLLPGGALFLSEKLVSPSPRVQDNYQRRYDAFKRAAGYSRTEIERKKEALEHVLVPLTLDEHYTMLERAGFAVKEVLFKWHNFVTIVAIKG